MCTCLSGEGSEERTRQWRLKTHTYIHLCVNAIAADNHLPFWARIKLASDTLLASKHASERAKSSTVILVDGCQSWPCHRWCVGDAVPREAAPTDTSTHFVGAVRSAPICMCTHKLRVVRHKADKEEASCGMKLMIACDTVHNSNVLRKWPESSPLAINGTLQAPRGRVGSKAGKMEKRRASFEVCGG